MIIVTLLPHQPPINPPSTPRLIPIIPPTPHHQNAKTPPKRKANTIAQKAYEQHETLLYKKLLYIVYNNKHTLFPSVLCVRFPLSLFNHQYVSILIRIDVSRIVLIARDGFMGCYGVLWGVMGCTWREPPTIHQYDSAHTNMPPFPQHAPQARTRPLNAIPRPPHRHIPRPPRSIHRRKFHANKSPFN